MDTHHATVVGRMDKDANRFEVMGHVSSNGGGGNSNENATNNQAKAARQKFFKEITSLMPNVDEIHVTGTGQVQEQFIHYLAATPQFKNAVSTESTSNPMDDAPLVDFFAKRFN